MFLYFLYLYLYHDIIIVDKDPFMLNTNACKVQRGENLMQTQKLFYTKPADPNLKNLIAWNEALPVGNGSLGAMVFGGIDRERIQLNEDTLWYGGGGRDRTNPDAKKYLNQIRSLLNQGEINQAQRLGKLSMVAGPVGERYYTTAGDMVLDFELDVNRANEYSRTLNLETATVSTNYQIDGVTYQREVFCSNVHKVLALRLRADKPEALHFILGLSRSGNLSVNRAVANNMVHVTGLQGEQGVSFCIAAKVVETDGEVYTIGNHILLEKATNATVLLTIRTSFYGDNPVEWCNETLLQAETLCFEELKQAHMEDYKKLYTRVAFDMPESAEVNKLPTDERLERVKQGNTDLGLISLYFNFGRYLLISCSRPGSQPANLQGIWNKDFNPPWDSKYTLNINTEMNYWPAEVCNLAECHMPLFDLLQRMLPNGKMVAEKMYGCHGFVAHHNTDIWGDCAPQDSYMPATIWPMGAAWLATHIWQHYQFTQDKRFLNKYFEIMQQSVLFFRDYMVENENGQLVTGPSVSPENTYIHLSGERGTLCMGPSMDSQIVTDLFSHYIDASKILGVQDELCQEIQEMLTKIPKPTVGKYGQIMEWAIDYEEAELGHRHISHLYALYPSNQLTYEKTPERMKNARITLERRLSNGGGHTGWSRAWIINMWARLRDGEEAGKNIQLILEKSTSANLFDMHPPFQIDGNLGACAGIVEMLVQSHEGFIRILPALPKTWEAGTITGVKARGNFEIDISWKSAKVKNLIVRSLSGNDCILILPNTLYISDTQGIRVLQEDERIKISGNGNPFVCHFKNTK